MGRTSLDKNRVKSPQKRAELATLLAPAFMKLGIKAISAKDLSTITGKSKATIYQHFSSKHEVIAYILAGKMEELEKFSSIINSEGTFEIRYKNAVSFVSKILKGITPIFFRDLEELHPELWKQIEQFKELALSVLGLFYKEGIRAESFNQINIEYLLLHDEIFFNALTSGEMLSNKNFHLTDAFDAYFEIRLHGIIRNK
ncbi:MAG: TetR/AcrR family transcriptional regulator [Flavobacteriales bacterium]|jgi:AcrR family transcriptional regulator|nr:TetR/AcrR family transcriptional regulator [Flavobacteriales bacterium]